MGDGALSRYVLFFKACASFYSTSTQGAEWLPLSTGWEHDAKHDATAGHGRPQPECPNEHRWRNGYGGHGGHEQGLRHE